MKTSPLTYHFNQVWTLHGKGISCKKFHVKTQQKFLRSYVLNATKIFLQLRHFLLDVFQEVRVEPIKSKLSYMASLWSIAVELTNSSAIQNHVVFQPTSEQAKYIASGILKRNQKAFAVFLWG